MTLAKRVLGLLMLACATGAHVRLDRCVAAQEFGRLRNAVVPRSYSGGLMGIRTGQFDFCAGVRFPLFAEFALGAMLIW